MTTRIIKKYIGKISLKGHIKVLLMVFLLVGIFSGYTFADDVSAKDNLVEIVYKTLSFLSRGWIILANLAGKLMTNDMVYGTFLHLDTVLWTFWNLMKNFANFLLAFLVVYSVLRNLLSPVGAKPKTAPLDIIKNTLLAGVLIQMSWFLVAATLDLSNVCTAAIGQFPSLFFVSNDEFERDIRDTIGYAYNHKVVVDYTQSEPIYFAQGQSGSQSLTDDDMNALLDTVLPSTDSLSGPLIYIGMSVFDLRDFNKQKLEPGENWGELFFAVGLNGIVVVAYSIIMLLLFIFNVMRILILWIVIPCMPLIILAKIFKFSGKEFLAQVLNIGNILKLIFKPVLMTGVLCIVLIIVVLIKGIIVGNANMSTLEITNGNTSMTSKLNSDQTYNSSMKVDGLLDIGISEFQEGFADIVVYLLGICLMLFVLKMATFNTGFKFIDGAIQGIFDKVKGIATAAPIIPIPGKKPISIEQANQYLDDKTFLTSVVGWNLDQQNAIVNDFLKIDARLDSLSDTMSREEFKAAARKILNSTYSIDNIKELKNNNKAYQELTEAIFKWNKRNKQDLSIEEIFEGSEDEDSVTNPSQTGSESEGS